MRRSTLQLASLFTVMLVALSAGAADRASLSGRVLDIDGKPVAGATVDLYEAYVRQGTGSYCPSCWADCGKHVSTAADGSFRMDDVDPQLVFNVLVVARGYQPSMNKRVDPAATIQTPIEIKIAPRPNVAIPPERLLRGVVTDPQGHPVRGASVEVMGYTQGSQRIVSLVSEEPMLVTGDDGTFEFTLKGVPKRAGVNVYVEARGLATRLVMSLKPGEQANDVKLNDGATVIGHLVDEDGKPIPNIEMGIFQTNRDGINEVFSPMTIGTDANGRFEFDNVPPNLNYTPYASMKTLGTRGRAVDGRFFNVGGDGSTLDIGVLQAKRGYRVSGQIVLTDGKPVPPHTHVTLGLDNGWDANIVDTDEAGRFTFAGVPKGVPIQLHAGIKGYRVSRANVSCDSINVASIVGVIDGDLDGLRFAFEPGEPPNQSDMSQEAGAKAERVKHEPLQGVK